MDFLVWTWVWLLDTAFELVVGLTIFTALIIICSIVFGLPFWLGYKLYDFMKGNDNA